jgi:lipopolysaccharide transport system ATP-binding protein
MYVRLAFAVAAHLQPEILLVDEVLAVGDIEFQKKCIGKMEEVAGEGRTVVVVSHSMSVVKALCARVILLESGLLKAIGPVDATVNTYLNIKQIDTAERIVSDEDHLTGVNTIRVRRIRLLNGVADNFCVYWQQPVSVSVEIEVTKQIDDVSFGVGIKLLDGTYVLNSHHDDNAIQSRWTLDVGNYNLGFTIRNSLNPGIYKLVIGAHHYHWDKNLFHLEAVNFQVLAYSQQGFVSQAYNPGFVTGDVSFQIPERLT